MSYNGSEIFVSSYFETARRPTDLAGAAVWGGWMACRAEAAVVSAIKSVLIFWLLFHQGKSDKNKE